REGVDGIAQRGQRRAGEELQDLHAGDARDLQRHGRLQRAVERRVRVVAPQEQRTGLRRGHRADVDLDVWLAGEVGPEDLGAGDGRGGQAGDDVVELAVEQLQAAEGRRVGDARDRLDRRVDLQLVGGPLLVADGARVGGLDDQALDRGEQVADLRQGAFGRRD